MIDPGIVSYMCLRKCVREREVYKHSHTHMHTYILRYTQIHTCTLTFIHTHTHTHTHTRTHTHTGGQYNSLTQQLETFQVFLKEHGINSGQRKWGVISPLQMAQTHIPVSMSTSEVENMEDQHSESKVHSGTHRWERGGAAGVNGGNTPYISAKEPYVSAKEPYVSAKGACVSAKERGGTAKMNGRSMGGHAGGDGREIVYSQRNIAERISTREKEEELDGNRDGIHTAIPCNTQQHTATRVAERMPQREEEDTDDDRDEDHAMLKVLQRQYSLRKQRFD